MNLFNIFHEIEKADPEFQERISPRRAAIKNMTGFGSKVALSALPLALGSLFQKAYGQAAAQPTAINDILNFALTLEYLESEFYTKGVAANMSNAAAAGDIAGLTLIRNDEANHVKFLQTALGAAAKPKPTFDFTAKGNFPDPLNPANYGIFLALAQAFEDTGVRAYKGQAPYLMSNKDVLTAALNIHSVEARHASHVRELRKVKSWITGNDSGGLPPQAQPIYNGEELDTQAGVKITGMSANGVTISSNAATEAFDEPLSYSQVSAIASLFIV